MAGGYKLSIHCLFQGLIAWNRIIFPHLRHSVANGPVLTGIFRSTKFGIGCTQHIDNIPCPFSIHSHRLSDIIHSGHDGKKQGGWNGDLVISHLVIIFHRVFTGNARHPVGPGIVSKSPVGPDQLRQFIVSIRCFIGQDRITPAEVVKPGHHLHTATDTESVTDCLIHAAGHHMVGVNI